jgi:hypothetical protein
MKTQFDALLGDLEGHTADLAKALEKGTEVEDEKIEAAKKDGAASEEEGEGSKTEDVAKDVKSGKASGKKAPLAKSLTVTLEDGTTVEAEDATELVKSLTENFGALTERFDASESVLAKALGQTVTLLKAQSTLITDLQKQVKAIAGEGRGRKAVLTVVEKPAGGTMAKGGQEGMNPNEFMAKAESQFKAGKISGTEISFIESAFNRGSFDLSPALIAKVTAA